MSRKVRLGFSSTVRRSMKEEVARKTGSPSTSSAIAERLAAANRSSAARSPLIQRASEYGVSSKPIFTPYSAAMRASSTSSCRLPTTPTMGGAPSCGRNNCTTPSSASSCNAWRSFFAFIASSSRTRRRISGAKYGTPMKLMSSDSLNVSPMRKVPWLGMPTTSPAKASSASWRSRAKKNCGACSGMVLPVRTCFSFMPRTSRPEQIRAKAMRSRWFGSILAWILNTKAVSPGSEASTTRLSAGWARGLGPYSAKPSNRSDTPISLIALPK